MTLKDRLRETAYSGYVTQKVLECLKARGAASFSLAQLALYCDLKPTHNFRRQVELMAKWELIGKVYRSNEQGHPEAAYSGLKRGAP